MSDRARLIIQIKALLARGNSPFEEEARTSLYVAHKKMRENGISYGDLESGTASPTPTLTSDQIEALRVAAVREHMQAIGSMGGQVRASRLTAAELSKIGKKGVKARMQKVSPEKRSEVAARAARARWGK